MASRIVDQLEPWADLNGKIVMITGASSGLGREFSLDLAKAGCRIVAAARRVDRLESLCDEINKLEAPKNSVKGDFPQAIGVELDVTADGRAIGAAVEKAWDAFGHIDALVNNAGVRGRVRSSLDISEEEWNHVMKTNLTGSWLVSKCIGSRMRLANKGGSIINISSIAGLNRVTVRGSVAYSSSKAALDSMTKVMALELGEYKIRVNAIAPGLFKSEITKELMEKNWLQIVAKRIVPLGTFGTSDPGLTSLIRYLVHDASNYVSGNIFIVDSGLTLSGLPIFSSL
ncbi:hypothetical protein ACJIZ3_005590 [Penstemon smallii]|uniref:3-oxoacyl-[acyl-carrier-protein] reductase n=1 Tax=Penstemon smallii TaxID=265156 RepID=A0ABD3S5J8_9LAMI